jgi:hypothetical protein
MTKLNEPKKRRERSTPYPFLTIEAALSLLGRLRGAGGKGPYSREFMAQCLEHKSLNGTAVRKIASLTHYGLLDRIGNAYTLCSNVEDFLNPVSEEQKRVAVIAAIGRPVLFAKLLEDFTGQTLPTKLDAILIRQGVSPTVAPDVATIFKANLEFAGMIQGGVLIDFTKNQVSETRETETSHETLQNPVDMSKPSSLIPSKTNFPPYTDFGDRWRISINADAPLSSATKKLLIDVSESIDRDIISYHEKV